MKYKAYLKQEGGCDYTIGCGIRVIDIEASDIIEAKDKLFKEVKETYNDSENRLSKVELYEINNILIINIEEWQKRFDNEEYELIQKEKEAAEYKEFLRLKSKYEK